MGKENKHKSKTHKEKKKPTTFWGKVWWFLWEEDSIWSWIANIILAFILIKFILYPGLGFALGTTHPVVAVVSGSMEHDGNFDTWWQQQESLYAQYNISKEEFKAFKLHTGFNKGDIMIITGYRNKEPQVGDVLVFWTTRSDPIIHRIVEVNEINGIKYAHTKGDHNFASLNEEMQVGKERQVGKATIRIPYLGWIKIWFASAVGWIVHR